MREALRTEVARYETSAGNKVYNLPVRAFPQHVTNCYLVLGDEITLIDTGSSMKESNDSLVACLAEVGEKFGDKVGLSDLTQVIITHGHIDHFGGLNFVMENSDAKVGIHELDKSTVRAFKERLIVSSKNLHVYLNRAGLDEDEIKGFIKENKWSKNVFRATEVDFTMTEGSEVAGGFEVFHTPGHCPGQVCLGLDDILFTADHVLSRITPNQSPEFIIRYNGLGHYMESLDRVRKMEGYRMGLGGHEDEIHDIPTRVTEIMDFHNKRLDRTLEICREPKTINQVAKEMFPKAKDYHVLLAILEAGAHVEYLHERGTVQVANIDEVEYEANPVLVYEHA